MTTHGRCTARTNLAGEELLVCLVRDFPEVSFEADNRFIWESSGQRVRYNTARLNEPSGQWALLHELGHAQLSHTAYTSDFELLRIERDAWSEAHRLAGRYHIVIDEDYVQDCLDSYRDWLHLRSTCPTCYERAFQTDKHTYRCHNCTASWHVTNSRLCRPYRRRKG